MASSGKIIDEFSYEERDILGAGQFGSVFRGKNRNTGDPVAIKLVPKNSLANPYLWNLLSNEINALSKLNSPYIVKFIALKETPHNFYIVTEFCDGGDLSKKAKRGKLPEEDVIDILYQLCEGFREMKRYNTIHRDIKPANILIHQGKLKIADLGFAKSVANFQYSMATSMVGSPMYMSPQLLNRQNYTSKCDIWSTGIILYQLMFGKVPWNALDMTLLAQAIMTQPLQFPKDVPISPDMIDVITRCLQINEYDRISWDELFNHRIFNRIQPIKPLPPTSPAHPISPDYTVSVQPTPHQQSGPSEIPKHPASQPPQQDYLPLPKQPPTIHKYNSQPPREQNPSPAIPSRLQNQSPPAPSSQSPLHKQSPAFHHHLGGPTQPSTQPGSQNVPQPSKLPLQHNRTNSPQTPIMTSPPHHLPPEAAQGYKPLHSKPSPLPSNGDVQTYYKNEAPRLPTVLKGTQPSKESTPKYSDPLGPPTLSHGKTYDGFGQVDPPRHFTPTPQTRKEQPNLIKQSSLPDGEIHSARDVHQNTQHNVWKPRTPNPISLNYNGRQDAHSPHHRQPLTPNHSTQQKPTTVKPITPRAAELIRNPAPVPPSYAGSHPMPFIRQY